jgi:hypothetical protein
MLIDKNRMELEQLRTIFKTIDPSFEASPPFYERVLREVKNEVAPKTVEFALFSHHTDTRDGIELIIDKIIFIIDHLTYRSKLKWGTPSC